MLQQNKIHRIFINSVIVIGDNIVADTYVTNHIKNVLRMKNNQDIKIFNGDGGEYLSKIQYENKSLIIRPVEESRRISRDTHKILLAQCISNSKSMDLAIQKSSELGADEIIPIISSRSHPGKHDKRISHWNKIIIHAVEQSNGLYLPALNNIISLEDFLSEQKNDKTFKICFNTTGRKIEVSDKSHKSYTILIGPEGGFDNEELDLIKNNNWNIISLGDRIFRTETASIVAQTILRGF